MNRETSIYLDAVRFSAAMVVMFAHLGAQSWSGGLGWQFGHYANTAVDVFFVLSGFVIAYVADAKEKDVLSYTISRLARLYSVCVPAIAITYILAIIGRHVAPAFYTGDLSAFALLRSLTFTHQIWFSSILPGNDGPYWSIGYEAVYYAIFAAAVYPARRLRPALAIVLCVLAGPRILLMFPVWLMGVAAYRVTHAATVNRTIALAGWAASALVFVLFAHQISVRQTTDPYLTAAFARPLSAWPTYGWDYAIGLAAAFNFLALFYSAPFWSRLCWMIHKPVRWLAGATFTIYLVHYPVALLIRQTSSWAIGSWQERALLFGGTIFSVFAIAHLTERRKETWRNAMCAAIRLLTSRSTSTALPQEAR